MRYILQETYLEGYIFIVIIWLYCELKSKHFTDSHIDINAMAQLRPVSEKKKLRHVLHL